MGLSAGKLRHRVRFDRYAPQTDTAGDPLRGAQGEALMEWVEIDTVWAAIEPLSAREFVQSGAKQSQVSARITRRYRDDITAGCRAVHGSKIYNIEGVLADRDSGLEYLTLPVSEGTSSGA